MSELECRWHRIREDRSVPAMAIFTTGCPHEHVREIPVCAPCLAKAQGYVASGGLYCTPCRECSEPHLCAVAILRVTETTGTCAAP